MSEVVGNMKANSNLNTLSIKIADGILSFLRYCKDHLQLDSARHYCKAERIQFIELVG